ncbi:hypothetical protein [Haloarcula sp. Atlit-47R]|jgi:hypothetical protein|uniref:hypothetical protein n=1 Tax=Haloarcula sp. Atlit-47R TaxID=2282132 RepID=UPI0012FEE905|nr:MULTISPECIES: hypothetical protein [Haloarcula]
MTSPTARQEVTAEMAIEKRGSAVITTGCPFCDSDIDPQQSLAKHLDTDCPEYGGSQS